jgi:hypothetical protein
MSVTYTFTPEQIAAGWTAIPDEQFFAIRASGIKQTFKLRVRGVDLQFSGLKSDVDRLQKILEAQEELINTYDMQARELRGQLWKIRDKKSAERAARKAAKLSAKPAALPRIRVKSGSKLPSMVVGQNMVAVYECHGDHYTVEYRKPFFPKKSKFDPMSLRGPVPKDDWHAGVGYPSRKSSQLELILAGE